MTAVTTVALLRRKDGMDAALFSKYWRDVHGMLATRIPGFRSYVQYHLDTAHSLAGADDGEPDSRLHGIAVVDFDSEAQRGGLAHSEVAGLIREDEVNLFQSSLLYNLPAGADGLWQAATAHGSPVKHGFLLLRGGPGESAQWLQQALQAHPDISALRSFALDRGDAGHWKTPGVDNQLSAGNQFDVMLQITAADALPLGAIAHAVQSLPSAPAQARLYPVQAAYAMVSNGRPTHLGLRGLDVLQTIEAAGADNQLEAGLLRCLYGVEA